MAGERCGNRFQDIWRKREWETELVMAVASRLYSYTFSHSISELFCGLSFSSARFYREQTQTHIHNFISEIWKLFPTHLFTLPSDGNNVIFTLSILRNSAALLIYFISFSWSPAAVFRTQTQKKRKTGEKKRIFSEEKYERRKYDGK